MDINKYKMLEVTDSGKFFLIPEEEIHMILPGVHILKALTAGNRKVTLSLIVRIFRAGLSLSKKEFCAKVGISRVTLDELESDEGNSKTYGKTLEKLSNFLGPEFVLLTDVIT